MSRRPSTGTALVEAADTRRPALLLAGALLAALCSALLAAPAHARYVLHGIPGAACNVDQSLPDHPWAYRGRKLVNTGSEPGSLIVATCAVSIFAPGARPLEYRLYMSDPLRRPASCQVFTPGGALLRTEHVDWTRLPGAVAADSTADIAWRVGLVEVTFHCLLRPGAAMERIEILFDLED